jgi:superfamily II DNA or RNA helicase
VKLTLRSWQSRFAAKLVTHRRRDFLLVACPAAGKTRGAGVAAAQVMATRDCDQLVVVCPTVVVRDQWKAELGQLGFRMLTDFRGAWPEHVHGVCVTYAQVAAGPHLYAQACKQRRTIVIFDEIHHAGAQLSWGEAIAEAFVDAVLRLMLSGTPFRSDADRIPFVRYDATGKCKPDFAYDYGTAVRDGVCRRIAFHAHDGRITWREDGGERMALFSQKVDEQTRGRRLRASLDPVQPYLRFMLESAHEDLLALRESVPDAAGLIVCDSQQHALQVDELIAEIAGGLPVLAMSDLPRAHQAIRAFAAEDEPWLVSVRMVSEGVDIPRLGVIVWATVASTELMVRQVAGRALRGRELYEDRPAIVHMPADPNLIRFAGRLEVLGGVSSRPPREREGHEGKHISLGPGRREDSIDPAPFLTWFDGVAASIGADKAAMRCGWVAESGGRRVLAWRAGEYGATLWTIVDALHMAGVGFEHIYTADEYAELRERAANPHTRGRVDFGAVDCEATSLRAIEPSVPERARVLQPADDPVAIATPNLPPSPEDLAVAKEAREALRGELLRMLHTYAQLQRSVNPAFLIATAHIELAAAVGDVGPDSPDEDVAAALDWIRAKVTQLATQHPEQVKTLARERRRLSLASNQERAA